MTNDEKQAVEIFTSLVNYLERCNKNLTIIPEDKKYYKTLLNLITKLQEESTKKDKRLNRQFKLLNKKEKQINQALDIAFNYGQADGEHHKAWVIDQMVKALTGKKYEKWVNDYIYDEETGDSYTWNKGIAP